MKAKDPNNPSSTFYWKDYENDEGLRISSLAAQGLWMRLLCIAAKAEPFGYVLVNGHALDATGAARLAGSEPTEAAALIAELERNGVFSRDRKGRMFSRRMVKEAATRAKNQKNGKKGGNPALLASGGKETTKAKADNRKGNQRLKPPYPIPNPLPSEVIGVGGVVGAGEPFFRRVLAAAGYNPSDCLPTHWMPPKAELEVVAWLTLPGMTEALAIRHVEESTRQRGRADGPRAFVRGLRALSAQAIAPPIPPPEPVPAPPQAASPEPHPGAPHARSPRPSRSDAKLDSFLRGATG